MISRTSHAISRHRVLRFSLRFALVVSLLLPNFSFIGTLAHAAAPSPWEQTDWSGGDGQASWSDPTRYDSSSNVETGNANEIRLFNIEEFSNPGFETDLSGWEMPTQTLALQPDATDGFDTMMYKNDPTSNYAGLAFMDIGEYNNDSDGVIRGLIRFDLSALPSDAVIGSAVLGLYTTTANADNAGTLQVFRQLRDWNESEASWNLWKTGNSWASPGGFGAADSEQSELGSIALSANETTDVFKNITLNATTKAGLDNGNGWLLKMDGEVDDSHRFVSSDDATPSRTPKLTIDYSFPSIGTRDTGTAFGGSTASAKLVAGLSTGTFTQDVDVGDTDTYNFFVYAYTDGSPVTSSDLELYYNGSTVSTSYAAAGGGWYRLSGTITGVASVVDAGVRVPTGRTVYVDEFSLKPQSGTLASSIFDVGQRADWGALAYLASEPANTSVTVKARTGNQSDLSDATAFVSCTGIASAAMVGGTSCAPNNTRYAQYQLTLSNTDSSTPTFTSISVDFTLVPTAADAISDLSASSGDGEATLAWSAPADGGSAITDYSVRYRAYGATPWTTSNHAPSTATSITIAGLNNGARYEFDVRAVNANGTASDSNLPNTVPMGILFQDDFDARTLGDISGQNGWTSGGDGTWNAATASGGKMLSGTTGAAYYTHYAANGSTEWKNERVQVDFQAVASGSAPQLWLRRSTATGDGDGYFLDQGAGVWYISINNGANGSGYSAPASEVSDPSLVVGNWYTVEFEAIDGPDGHPVLKVYLYDQGDSKPVFPLITYTDATDLFQGGYVGLGTNSAAVNFDNLVVYGTSDDGIAITAPARGVAASPETATLAITDESGIPFYIPYIQTGTTLTTAATVGTSILPASGGVKFILDEGSPAQQIQYDMTAPFSVNFTGLAKGTYTLDTYVVNASHAVQSGAGTHDRAADIGIGDIITAIGDSITMGYAGSSYGATPITDWTNAPAGSVSSDNRNYPQYGPQGGDYYKSFMTELNDRLSDYYGYPVFVMNEGWGGYTTADYIALMGAADWTNRQTALAPNKWLIDLGVNDAGASVPPGTYEANLETIIGTLTGDYGALPENIFLSRPNYATSVPQTTVLPTYLPIVDGLVASDELLAGADFYTYFSNHHAAYYVDTVHPNPAGFAEIARISYIAMIAPQHLAVGQSAGTVTLTWDDLSPEEPTISGYKVKYGTASGTYATTVDAGNVTTRDITGLSSGQTYYFVVSAYDDDAADVNQSANSAEVSVLYDATGPVLSETTPVPTPSAATAPSYAFTSDEAGDITYGGDCSSATTAASSGANTVTFDTLAIGTHSNCTITVTDAADNDSNILAVTAFEITAPATPTPAPAPSHSSGGGYNPILSDRPGYTAGQVITPTAPVVSPVCTPYLSSFLKMGDSNADVSKLQTFLKTQGFFTFPTITGFFGPVTFQAVKEFQLKYAADILASQGLAAPTGFVGVMTVREVNGIRCGH